MSESTATTDQMSPAASPGKMGVRRVNNVPVYLFGAVFGAFLLIMALVAADRAAKQNQPGDGQLEKAGNTSLFAKEIVGEETGGIIAPSQPLVPPADPVLIAKPDLDAPPPPPGQTAQPMQAQPETDEEAMRIRMAKMQQLEAAVKSKTAVQTGAPRSSGSTPGGRTTAPQTREEVLARIAEMRQQADAQRPNNPTAAYQERLAQIRNMIGGSGAGGSSSAAPQLLQASTGSVSPFANGGADRWKLDSQVEAPRSPYELRAGFVIPATLISGINSELPGQIIAQVSQNVFDTPTGKHLLIPQGCRLIGTYSSEVKYAQSRVMVAWQRIIFPDGKAFDIGSMPGSDSAGYAGFNDQVNNHYLRLFGSAFLMSAITGGITYSQRQDQTQNAYGASSASSAMSEALGQQLGQVTAQMVARNLSVSPTLEIRPGYRFNVVVTKDMTFTKPYRSFDY